MMDKIMVIKKQIIIKKTFSTRKIFTFTDLSFTYTEVSTRKPFLISSKVRASCIRIKCFTQRTNFRMRIWVMMKTVTNLQQELAMSMLKKTMTKMGVMEAAKLTSPMSVSAP